MEVSLKRAFIKDLRKIPANTKQKIELFVFDDAIRAKSIEEISDVKAIKGYSGYFRKRFGDYRIGFKIIRKEIIFYRVLHRKDIYRYFP